MYNMLPLEAERAKQKPTGLLVLDGTTGHCHFAGQMKFHLNRVTLEGKEKRQITVDQGVWSKQPEGNKGRRETSHVCLKVGF